MSIPNRQYGNSDIHLSALGLGAAQLGDSAVDEGSAFALLEFARDAGINFVDTAPSYGRSEERLGRYFAKNPRAFAVSTKLGYGVPGIDDWTGPCIRAGIDLALQRLQIDHIDIAHFHSCPKETLQRDDVIRALEDARQHGKVRAAAYSGEGDALHFAVNCGRFDGFMASLNLFDQRVIDETLPLLHSKGFIAKRPLANAPWRFTHAPIGDYCEPYWHRWQTMQLPEPSMAWGEMATRFAVWQNGVVSAIVGTATIGHLRECLHWAEKGPLGADHLAALRDAFRRNDRDWIGQV